jgi:hypothetical protein
MYPLSRVNRRILPSPIHRGRGRNLFVKPTVPVYVEVGTRRGFGGAIDWPVWCRSGRDEDSALQTLVEYGPRYTGALGTAGRGFEAPTDVSALHVVERLEGDATTDFGAPAVAPASDQRPVDEAELKRLRALLQACWDAFDAAAKGAAGAELRKGPREPTERPR